MGVLERYWLFFIDGEIFEVGSYKIWGDYYGKGHGKGMVLQF